MEAASGMPDAYLHEYENILITTVPKKLSSTEKNWIPSLIEKKNTDGGHNDKDDLSVTTGVFLLILIAVSTAFVLFCCKAYVLCKSLRCSSSDFEDGDTHSSSRRSLGKRRYHDQPPCYDDVLSGRVATQVVSGSKIDNPSLSERNSEEDICVEWPYPETKFTSLPDYSTVLEIEYSNEPQPPVYICTTRSSNRWNRGSPPALNSTAGTSGSSDIVNNNLPQDEAKALRKSLKQTLSAAIKRCTAMETDPDQDDPSVQIRYDGNISQGPCTSKSLQNLPSTSEVTIC